MSFSPKTNSLFFHQIHLWVVKSPLKQFHVIPRSWVFHNGVSNPFKSRTHYFKILFLIEPSISKTNTYLNTISVHFNSQNIALSNIFYHFFSNPTVHVILCDLFILLIKLEGIFKNTKAIMKERIYF